MKKHNKLFSVLSVVIILSLVVAFLLFAVSYIVQNDILDSYDESIAILNQKYPSDIILYGEEIDFRSELNYRTIETLSKESLTSDEKYEYTFLIINDRQGNVKMTDEKIKELKILVDEMNISFYYIGQQYLSNLKDAGFYSNAFNDDYNGIGYVVSPTEKGHASVHGLWTSVEEEHYKKNSELLGQVLVYSFVDDVIKILN